MVFSQYVQNLSIQYGLTGQELIFAILCSSGLSHAESYAVVFNTLSRSEQNNRTKATELLARKPTINECINDFRQRHHHRKDNNAVRAAENKTSGTGWNEDETTAENLARIVKGEIGGLEGKDKINASITYAKLIGLDIEKRNNVYYYLPLRCSRCKLRNNE